MSTRRGIQLTRQELLKTHRDIAIPINIILLEHIRHPLQRNAALHEQIKTHRLTPPLLICPVQYSHKCTTQPIPECHQRFRIFIKRYVSAPILIKTIKQAAPSGEEGPQAAELVEVDGACFVGVEHADHHLHGVRVEGGPVAVDQSGAQLFLCQMTGALLIDSFEEWEQ